MIGGPRIERLSDTNVRRCQRLQGSSLGQARDLGHIGSQIKPVGSLTFVSTRARESEIATGVIDKFHGLRGSRERSCRTGSSMPVRR